MNKTPITYSTNREVGGAAPSVYMSKIVAKVKVTQNDLMEYISTHLIDVSCCNNDDFQGHILNRVKMLLPEMEVATGKAISGKESDEVIK